MKIRILPSLLGLVLIISLTECASPSTAENAKMSRNDPFKKSMVSSQNFLIDSSQDQVIEGKDGTRIVLPKACFLNDKGEVVQGMVSIELAEALSLEDMLSSNLTTDAAGTLGESAGALYFNASLDGEKLSINPDVPIYIEVPTADKKAGMMAHVGLRDEDGNMSWLNPKPVQSYLVPVDILQLDFYPAGFEDTVASGLPFRGQDTLSKKLTDSLYFSLTDSAWTWMASGFTHTLYNEPLYNSNAKVVDGKYTARSFRYYDDKLQREAWRYTIYTESLSATGIDPIIIKTIWDDKFQNTLLATREFETRLQSIFKSCEDEVLELYIKNLGLKLWEIDSMASEALKSKGKEELAQKFRAFADQRLGKVKGANRYASLLKYQYEISLALNKRKLKKIRKKAKKELESKNQVARELANEYKEVLVKREKHRMERYGFEWSSTGWTGLFIPSTKDPDFSLERLEYKISQAKNYDQLYCYAIYTSIHSLNRLNTQNGEDFYVGNKSEKSMLMPYKKPAVAVAVAYDEGQTYLGIRNFETATDQNLEISLNPVSEEDLKAAFKKFNAYKMENRIEKDLYYMKKFAQEQKRQERLKSEAAFIYKLWRTVRPCASFAVKDSAYIVPEWK